MRKIITTTALFLSITQGDYTIGHHDHVHHELPKWEALQESKTYTSGTTGS